MSKFKLGHDERRILLQSLAVRCTEFFARLEAETMDLDVMDYFDAHYKKLWCIMRDMERCYPDIDMSAFDIDVLHRRKHLRD